MINRFYLENYLSFQKVDLEFEKGLIVFTGPSGAGKSILMDAFLALFGIKEAKADLSETTIEDSQISYEEFGIEKNDEIIIKELKKDKVRYFLNSQTISKKALTLFANSLVKHLHLKDNSDFDSIRLVRFLDRLSASNDASFENVLKEYKESFSELTNISSQLKKINDDESKLEELKEFAKFEIEKIESINPKIDEYEELNEIKKRLAKKDKIEEAILMAKGIFEYRTSVSKALDTMDKDSSFFDETINELENIFENFSDSLSELEELDIEAVLDRIEKLSSLQKRFGSIKEAIEYKEQKQAELDSYDNISFEKTILEKKVKVLTRKVEELASNLSVYRNSSAKILEEKVNYYLKYLYLSNAKIYLKDKQIDALGKDEVALDLNGVNLETISSGEFNRLRLALLTSISKFEILNNGILFLDEIDANLSGKESDAIATVLKELSKSYQIFAISHQPQLTAAANQHFFVDKQNGVSSVKILDDKGKIEEISRMISGENITKEAYEFAKNLVDSK
ncbi:AAA family ATPase [Arcobacter sp. KX21116]|uniref:AAA family ATPase n=1 Tax=Arcobacter iocasae TaxID=2906515 RepID=UPI0035D4F81F